MLFYTRLTILLFMATFVVSCQDKKNTSSKLVGVWALNTIDQKDTNNIWSQASWMQDGQGLLHYDNKMHMSVHFTPKNYDLYSDSLIPYWYFGKYYHNADSDYVEHLRLLHSNPSENGKTVRRELTFNRDTLVMYSKEFGMRLKWVKVK